MVELCFEPFYNLANKRFILQPEFCRSGRNHHIFRVSCVQNEVKNSFFSNFNNISAVAIDIGIQYLLSWNFCSSAADSIYFEEENP
jgi:hypothetical protein